MDKMDICYFNELWLKPNEKYLLNPDKIYSKTSKDIFLNSDIDSSYNKGRPFGGQAWAINKNFKTYECNFINRFVSFIHIGICQYEFIIIGVHLPCESQKEKFLSKIDFESTLSIMSTLLEKYSRSDIPCLIIGDFNADLKRFKSFDNLLKVFIEEKSLLVIDLISKQSIDYSYQNYNNFMKGKCIYKSHIDHCLYK